MTILSWPFAGAPTTDIEYSRLMREILPWPTVSGPIGGPSLAVTADGTGMTVDVSPGVLVVRGCVLQVIDAETLPVGAAGATARIDRVVARLTQSAAIDGDPRITLAVKPGTTVPPALEQTDDAVYEVSLAQINVAANTPTIGADAIIDERPFGLAWTTQARPTSPKPGLIGWNTTIKTLEWWNGTAWASVLPAATIPNLDASKITGGTLALARIPTLDAARVPNLDAGKITSGTLALARIPNIDAARIPNHDASKITSGTLPVARGGTGQTTAAATRNALGLGNTTGAVPVANGGTGANTAADALAALGLRIARGTATSVPNGERTITLPAGRFTAAPTVILTPRYSGSGIQHATLSVSSASASAFTFGLNTSSGNPLTVDWVAIQC